MSGEYFTENNTFIQTSSDTLLIPTYKWGKCVFVDTNLDTGMKTYDCWKIDYYYGGLTLMFIYLPSSYTMAAVLGPGTAGLCSLVWGLVMAIVGIVMSVVGSANDVYKTIGLFMRLLGFGTFCLGVLLIAQQRKNLKSTLSQQTCGSFVLKFLLYPILFIFSPLIFVYIKFLTILKKDSKMVKSQKTFASMGEAILEAGPQCCLQMYVVLNTLDPSTSQWMSIFSSLLTLNIPNIEKYPEPSEFLDLLPVMILNTGGKILSISIIAVFFKYTTLTIIAVHCGAVFVLLLITYGLYGLYKEQDKWQQLSEAVFLGFLTQTNLSETKAAKIFRMFVFYFSLIFYSGTVMTIMIICNTKPLNVVIPSYNGGHIIWKDLALVQHVTILNTICGLTLSFFVLSWFMDIVCQRFADIGGVYHSAWRQVCSCCT